MTELNTSLVSQVLEQIDTHPETWNQAYWRTPIGYGPTCGTAHCFAGWVATLTGWVWLNDVLVEKDDQILAVAFAAAHELGITDAQALRLFAGGNDRDDLDDVLDQIKNGVKVPLLSYQK
jgi:hypothetical protein